MRNRIFCLTLFAGLLVAAGDETGIRPRPAASDYPARTTAHGVTIAAAVVPPADARKLLLADLDRDGYMVLEVAVYPEEGRDVELATRDFMISAGSSGATLRTASPEAIASVYDRKHSPEPRLPGNVTVVPTATIGYESGTYNGRRAGGVYTGAGVGVGVGGGGGGYPPPSSSSDPDGYEVRRELRAKALPEGAVNHAVAGYLYFPKPRAKGKKTEYKLTWYGPEGQMHLAIPQSAK